MFDTVTRQVRLNRVPRKCSYILTAVVSDSFGLVVLYLIIGGRKSHTAALTHIFRGGVLTMSRARGGSKTGSTQSAP